jgi:leucine-rich repeat protein SHOC2
MIKLNIFILLSFFLIINSDNCKKTFLEPCNCSTASIDEYAYKKDLELFVFDCVKTPQNIPEIQNIKGIYINSKKISSLPDNLISNETCFYKNITRLEITNTIVNSIQNSDFKCLSKLEQLDLSRNEITKINADVFQSSGEMIQLYLNDNKITNVDQNSFCGLSKLLLLDLQHNLITSLPAKICFPQQVQQLYLSYNHIKSKIL